MWRWRIGDEPGATARAAGAGGGSHRPMSGLSRKGMHAGRHDYCHQRSRRRPTASAALPALWPVCEARFHTPDDNPRAPASYQDDADAKHLLTGASYPWQGRIDKLHRGIGCSGEDHHPDCPRCGAIADVRKIIIQGDKIMLTVRIEPINT